MPSHCKTDDQWIMIIDAANSFPVLERLSRDEFNVALLEPKIPGNTILAEQWRESLVIFVFYEPGMTPERQERLLSVLKKRQDDITVVLENVHDPHNISAVMRTCDAIGMQEIYVLNTTIQLHKKWGPKSSSSASRWLTIHQFTDAATCFAAIREKYELVLSTHLDTEAITLYSIDFTRKIALIFGNEHDGVSSEIRKLADGNFIIPQVGMIKSLNISVACAVTLYEAFRQKEQAGHYSSTKLPLPEQLQLLKHWGYNDHKE